MLDLVNSVEIKNDKEAVDFVVKHLLTQNQKSECEGSCYYRSKDVLWYTDNEYDEHEYEFTGRACAAGALIKDSEYNEDFENEPASDPHVIEAIKASHPGWNFNESSVKIVLTLQRIHDSFYPSEWPLLLTFFSEMVHEEHPLISTTTVEDIMVEVKARAYTYLRENNIGFVAISANNLRNRMMGDNSNGQ